MTSADLVDTLGFSSGSTLLPLLSLRRQGTCYPTFASGLVMASGLAWGICLEDEWEEQQCSKPGGGAFLQGLQSGRLAGCH